MIAAKNVVDSGNTSAASVPLVVLAKLTEPSAATSPPSPLFRCLPAVATSPGRARELPAHDQTRGSDVRPGARDVPASLHHARPHGLRGMRNALLWPIALIGAYVTEGDARGRLIEQPIPAALADSRPTWG
ncbi:hypothetical protein OYE22_17465 [Streptomyces sp. 71268]|uniref:hypothetical protein n=1 Tax=Streptomyces sp. 71268 TaxID=3002640 RepID=UPI0023F7ABB7|nr:hypothetical protein [Streptomyces sp. 71268]WEV26786.1 hypothetical protein OYE22_17465 [Streptomyces sp. 71268]